MPMRVEVALLEPSAQRSQALLALWMPCSSELQDRSVLRKHHLPPGAGGEASCGSRRARKLVTGQRRHLVDADDFGRDASEHRGVAGPKAACTHANGERPGVVKGRMGAETRSDSRTGEVSGPPCWATECCSPLLRRLLQSSSPVALYHMRTLKRPLSVESCSTQAVPRQYRHQCERVAAGQRAGSAHNGFKATTASASIRSMGTTL